MRKTPIFAAVAAAMLIPSVMPSVAVAQDNRRYDDRRDNDRTYRASDGRYYACNRTNGTTGTVVGGVGGAVAGNVLGGGLLGTVAGGVGGALLGRHIDKKRTAAKNREHGC